MEEKKKEEMKQKENFNCFILARQELVKEQKNYSILWNKIIPQMQGVAIAEQKPAKIIQYDFYY